MTERVLLFELRGRTSAAGNRYLSGWLGKASVVAFLDRDADEPTWQVFVSTPTPRPAGDQPQLSDNFYHHPQQRRTRRKAKLAPGELDDPLPDFGKNPQP